MGDEGVELTSRDGMTSALTPGIHCAGMCRDGRDSRTMPRMTARALMIRRSEIAMAIVSARSSRRSRSSGPVWRCQVPEPSGGGNPFVLKPIHSCEMIHPRSAQELRSSPNQRHTIAQPGEISTE